MASFRRFADLPKELRDMIWDYASHRNLCGVQIFELRTPEPKRDGETSGATTSGIRPPRHLLDAPLPSKCFPALDGSPGNSNASRYMADVGLWTACKESRGVMEKATRGTKKILEMQAKQRYLYSPWQEHVPASISFSTSQRLLVQPHADLFVIQPSKIEDIDWSQVARDIRNQLQPRGFRFGIHIGIELDGQWGIRQSDDYLYLLCDAFRDIRAQLWIIDHNLKIREDIDKNEINSGNRVFYTCDRRFVEVDWKRQGLKHWRYIKPLERKCGFTGEYESSISLAERLDRKAADCVSDYHVYGQYGEAEDARFNCEVKLLGWDDL
ncbi:uncharacterized protein FTJAE_4550 [Fusarium tjaetaba]|uniref:2EXR domain-containing protein n=1 Tax=Fusarium tjaetaba TaxID=1567544 RepID=A0A8H5RVR4_9HYPO|nr:uncharacterized protein FTJAE_4550 [Fusarium tjaetaba]KAF5640004.1 hypothetical protein FTJAE_4550 [Fusarium tjaetaba]